MSETNETPGAAALSTPSAADIQAGQQSARAELATIFADADLRGRYLSGDAAMKARIGELHRQAYGDGGAAAQVPPASEAAPREEPAPEPQAAAPDAVSAHAYNLRFPEEANLADAKAIKQAADVGEALSASGLPPAIGNAIFARGVELWRSNGGKAPDDAQAALSAAQAKAELVRQYGERAGQILADARAMVAEAVEKNPAVAHMLEMTGLGSDPWAIATLANMWTNRGK